MAKAKNNDENSGEAKGVFEDFISSKGEEITAKIIKLKEHAGETIFFIPTELVTMPAQNQNEEYEAVKGIAAYGETYHEEFSAIIADTVLLGRVDELKNTKITLGKTVLKIYVRGLAKSTRGEYADLQIVICGNRE